MEEKEAEAKTAVEEAVEGRFWVWPGSYLVDVSPRWRCQIAVSSSRGAVVRGDWAQDWRNRRLPWIEQVHELLTGRQRRMSHAV